MKQRVFVGLSGGVDSSVAAKRLIESGYDVTGVFIKTWQPDFIPCTWEAERRDAMRVAASLGIPFLTCDAEAAYRDDVAGYMIREYAAGRTPNPDVMCNKYVKFGTFLSFAKAHGADKVATGHYAHMEQQGDEYILMRGKDTEKDQSYFLWTLNQEQRAALLFPIGDTEKSDIRREAKRAGLPTHAKEDSQGICFLGEIDMKEFLMHMVDTTPGTVRNEQGEQIGTHDGALLYTIGQRHGFAITDPASKEVPQYVISKDIESNTITVAPHQKTAQGSVIRLREVNWIGAPVNDTLSAQFRYRQKPFTVSVEAQGEGNAVCTVQGDVESPSLGQSCVFYDGDTCRGGGIIDAVE